MVMALGTCSLPIFSSGTVTRLAHRGHDPPSLRIRCPVRWFSAPDHQLPAVRASGGVGAGPAGGQGGLRRHRGQGGAGQGLSRLVDEINTI